MQKSEAILESIYLVKSAKAVPLLSRVSNFFSPVTSRVTRGGKFIKKQYRKVPGTIRYGLGTATTAAFPTMMYMSGKSEAEDHVANKAYEDAYNLTQQRIGKEWENLPAWQRYAVGALGVENAMAAKNFLSNMKNEPLTYSSIDATGNKTYY